MKAEILRLLKESDSYLSGQQLCDRFQVSRTAVWKMIEQLKKDGYEIEAVRNKGYRLIHSPDVLSEEEIKSLVRTTWAGSHIIFREEMDSTNTQAKLLGEQKAPHGTLVVTDRQIMGKGRRGRSWESPAGVCIYMSILLRPELKPSSAPMLTLVMALAAADAVRKQTGLEAKIKWPNDLVLNGKKICGILTEMSAEPDYINHVVIGVGINVNQMEFPPDICDTATSLLLESEKMAEASTSLVQESERAGVTPWACGKIRRAELLAAVMEEFEKYYGIFMETGNLSGLADRYNEMLINRGREVKILEPGHTYTAQAKGINDTGELLVCLPDGEERHIFAGEVSVRGVYGYV